MLLSIQFAAIFSRPLTNLSRSTGGVPTSLKNPILDSWRRKIMNEWSRNRKKNVRLHNPGKYCEMNKCFII